MIIEETEIEIEIEIGEMMAVGLGGEVGPAVRT